MEHKPLYKVGDRVTIKKREGPETNYPCTFVDNMIKYSGNTYTISRIELSICSSNHRDPKRYKYPSDGYNYFLKEIGWTWSSSMFEQEKKIKLNKKQIKLNFSL